MNAWIVKGLWRPKRDSRERQWVVTLARHFAWSGKNGWSALKTMKVVSPDRKMVRAAGSCALTFADAEAANAFIVGLVLAEPKREHRYDPVKKKTFVYKSTDESIRSVARGGRRAELGEAMEPAMITEGRLAWEPCWVRSPDWIVREKTIDSIMYSPRFKTREAAMAWEDPKVSGLRVTLFLAAVDEYGTPKLDPDFTPAPYVFPRVRPNV